MVDIIDITEPLHIPECVYEIAQRAVQHTSNNPLYVFFLHRGKPSVIRGKHQQFTENQIVPEIRRPDGGLTWYHPHTICVMRAHTVQEQRAHGTIQQAWSSEIIDWIQQITKTPTENFKYKGSDIYNDANRQVVGLSAFNTRINQTPVYVNRAAWYEQDPTPDIESILRADGIEPSSFSSALQVLPDGFHRSLIDMLGADINNIIPGEEYACAIAKLKAKELQKQRPHYSPRLQGACILSRE